VTVIIIWAIAMLLVPRIIKEKPSAGVIAQAMFRSNYILFAIPVIRQLYPYENTGITDILIAFILPLYNILAVITLETFRGGKIKPGKILLGIVKNPIVVGAAIGLCIQLLNINLPYIAEKALLDISRVATPFALIVLGASFEFSDTKKYIKSTLIATLFKLFIVPLIFVSLSVLVGFRGIELAVLFVLYGAPVAVSSYTMSAEMEGNSELAAQIIVFTSIGAVISIFLGIFILRSLMLI